MTPRRAPREEAPAEERMRGVVKRMLGESSGMYRWMLRKLFWRWISDEDLQPAERPLREEPARRNGDSTEQMRDIVQREVTEAFRRREETQTNREGERQQRERRTNQQEQAAQTQENQGEERQAA